MNELFLQLFVALILPVGLIFSIWVMDWWDKD